MSTLSAKDPKLSYSLSFPEASTHYVEVQMTVDDFQGKELVVTMPVWAPGSYLVREFARNVEAVQASSEGKSLTVEKRSKNAWAIKNPSSRTVLITYRVYAFELTVRTSFIDAAHAYLNGTSIFMYLEGKKELPSVIRIKPDSRWKELSTGLDPVGGDKWTLSSPNYDVLADSPIEIGNQEILRFDLNGIPHEVALYGGGNYDPVKLAADMKRICAEAMNVFGTHPCQRYVFIVHCLPKGGGGLEHLNSTTLQTNKFGFSSSKSYNGFLALVAHEYFHLWNVKRLRPAALGPFDYNQENYTTMLWFSEGFTAYYDNLLTRRAGFYSPEAYLDEVAGDINRVLNIPGNTVQPLSEASFDAWIKFYRPNENSSNTTVSYYAKGSLIALMLDMEIMRNSKGSKNLDALMHYLYGEYYLKKNRGFTDAEFKAAAEQTVGKNLDSFWAQYINGTELMPFNDYLSVVGLQLRDDNAGKKLPFIGIGAKAEGGKLMVGSVTRGSGAYEAGINVNDELIAWENNRMEDLAPWLNGAQIGQSVDLTIAREGIMQIIPVQIKANTTVNYRFELLKTADTAQESAYDNWLRKN